MPSHLQDFAASCTALFLMFWLYTSSLTAILIPWYQLLGFGGREISTLCIISILFVLCLLSYAAASMTSPGAVPKWYSGLHPTKEKVESRATNAEKPRWCEKCCAPKPPRAHHCSACGFCVLKMDHHCPWISNCVGFFNHKHFLQFLAFTLLAMLTITIALVLCLIPSSSGSFVDIASMPQMLILIINLALFIVLLTLMAVMLTGNLAQASKNMTAIEKEEMEYARVQLNESVIFPYTFPKTLRNFQAVFGTNWLLWLLPIPGTFHLSEHDGCTFPTRKGSLREGYWPLFDYSKFEEQDEDTVDENLVEKHPYINNIHKEL